MIFESFGRTQEDKETEIDQLLRDMPDIDSISAKMVLTEAYDTAYEIYNHNNLHAHPWGVVLDHYKEDYTNYGTLYRTIFSYRLRDVYKRYGLNIKEFLELPREFVELLLEASGQEAKQDNEDAATVAQELDEKIRMK